MDKIKIRKVRVSDAKYMLPLARQIGYPITIQESTSRLKEAVKQKEDIFLVAVNKNDEVIGFVQGLTIIEVLTAKTLRLGGLIVHEDYRSKGVGKKLMQALETVAKKNKHKLILVPTNIKRKGAHKFYEKIGYKKLKTQAVYAKEF